MRRPVLVLKVENPSRRILADIHVDTADRATGRGVVRRKSRHDKVL